jgi:hypothetical protein
VIVSTLMSVGVSMGMALAVDLGIYRAVSSAAVFRTAWVAIMLVLMLGGCLGFIGIVGWFAFGDPARQISLRRWVHKPVEASTDPAAT